MEWSASLWHRPWESVLSTGTLLYTGLTYVSSTRVVIQKCTLHAHFPPTPNPARQTRACSCRSRSRTRPYPRFRIGMLPKQCSPRSESSRTNLNFSNDRNRSVRWDQNKVRTDRNRHFERSGPDEGANQRRAFGINRVNVVTTTDISVLLALPVAVSRRVAHLTPQSMATRGTWDFAQMADKEMGRLLSHFISTLYTLLHHHIRHTTAYLFLLRVPNPPPLVPLKYHHRLRRCRGGRRRGADDALQ